ncbi:hypothetical protein DXG01_002530 [Tephrocybe rancida]|nr:hypothetical protein DXG01_002530 [Tephrocybe rancida]
MASDQLAASHANNGPPEVNIAFVVESSLNVANDWVRILMEYVFPMLRRLLEVHVGSKPRLAFITYAMADTLPSPLLCKRFFIESPPVTKEMKESPTNLGIGSTNSGGQRGMAALEGLVAAIEFFDVLMSVLGRHRQYVNHIFHIASASPDSSVHPRWNDSPNFDSITWEAMPAELKKASPGAPKEPFFPTRPSHSVFLAGFPMSPQKPSIKRPSDTHTTPDPKRARLAPPVDVSPKVQTPNTPSTQPKPSPILPPQPKLQPPTQPQHQPPPQVPVPASAPTVVPNFPQMSGNAPQNPQLAGYNLPNVLAAAKTVEEQIRGLHANIQIAQNKGNTTQLGELMQELQKKQALQQRFKAVLYSFKAQQQAQAAQAQLKSANPGQNQDAPVPQANIPPSQPGMEQQALSAMMHQRTASGSGPAPGLGPGPGPNPGPPRGPMPPQGGNIGMAAQMQQIQKMADLQQRARIQPNMPGPSNTNAGMQPAGPPQSHLGPPVDQRPPTKGPNSIWQGSLSFSGTDTQGIKKDTVVWVIGTSPNPAESSRTETWPSAMPLQPANRAAVPLTDLQAWIHHHRPILCTFAPQTHGIADPVGNEANFKALTTLLIQRKAYAVSAWTLPSGEQGNNILFFPVNINSLGAACFPVTGLPELPRPSQPQPQQMPNLLALDLNNPDLRARLQAMSIEQREQFMKQFKQQRALHVQRMMSQQNAGNNPGANNALMAMNGIPQQNQQMQQPQQQQQQQQQHLDMGFVGNVHPPGNYGGMGMMNTMGLGQQQQAMMAGMPRPVNAGMRNPMPPNINYEMMQSFMQRNLDGGGMGQ